LGIFKFGDPWSTDDGYPYS